MRRRSRKPPRRSTAPLWSSRIPTAERRLRKHRFRAHVERLILPPGRSCPTRVAHASPTFRREYPALRRSPGRRHLHRFRTVRQSGLLRRLRPTWPRGRSRLRPQSQQVMAPVVTQASWRSTPTTYVVLTEDQAIPPGCNEFATSADSMAGSPPPTLPSDVRPGRPARGIAVTSVLGLLPGGQRTGHQRSAGPSGFRVSSGEAADVAGAQVVPVALNDDDILPTIAGQKVAVQMPRVRSRSGGSCAGPWPSAPPGRSETGHRRAACRTSGRCRPSGNRSGVSRVRPLGVLRPQ